MLGRVAFADDDAPFAAADLDRAALADAAVEGRYRRHAAAVAAVALGEDRARLVVAPGALRDVAHAEGAALVHCAAGKDRTGVVVALVVGANDVTNPAAREDKDSPIYGMPILNVDKAHNVVVLKRSMASGFAGIDNPLYDDPKTVMLFGDAKKSIDGIVAGVKAL